MALRPPYLRCLSRQDGVTAWRVDGHFVRDHVDVEFTNGHHHFSRRYIPINEIWLDRDARGAREWAYWLLHQRIERALMSGGVPYLRAFALASRVEQRERLLAHGLDSRPSHSEVGRAVRLRRLGRIDGREAWLVSGKSVRDLAYADFTLGGHGFRFAFIPKTEIWIDNAVSRLERPAILHHEAVEVSLMARGMTYLEAHRLASRAEARFRRAALSPGERRGRFAMHARR